MKNLDKNVFINLAKKILEENKNTPMSVSEIWKYAIAKGYDKQISYGTKTPEKSLQSRLYTNQKSFQLFDRIGSAPVRFLLKGTTPNATIQELEQKTLEPKEDKRKNKQEERKLHPAVTYFGRSNFSAYLKTINDHSSLKGEYKEWMHPDIVGVYFPFDDWQEQLTIELSQKLGCLPLKIYSFEIKLELNAGNLRKNFFQAVSNSSWAHEGYIVASDVSIEPSFIKELKRLSSLHGIGVIRLDKRSPESSEILFPASEKQNLDWDTIDKMASLNPDFKAFVERIIKDCNNKEIIETFYDTIEEFE